MTTAARDRIPDDWQRVPADVPQTAVYLLVRLGLVEYEFRTELIIAGARHSFMWWRRVRG